ncbi:hypothetical protein JZN54_004292 [Vibrio vulnificus]|nr:hypothetical protein [Vibrio vulnificus]
MLGGRLDAEGYFAAKFTTIKQPNAIKKQQICDDDLLLKFNHENMEFTVQFKLDLADKNSLCLTPG